ncbi:hypothetical protein EDM41_14835, partial [Staphylococcus aureus]
GFLKTPKKGPPFKTPGVLKTPGVFPLFGGKGPPLVEKLTNDRMLSRGGKNFLGGFFKKTPQKRGAPPFLKNPPGGFLKNPPGVFSPLFWGGKRGGPQKIFSPPGEKIFPPGGKNFGGFFKNPKKGAPF